MIGDWGQISVNGRLMPAAEATVSPLDRGLLYGDGIFETIRVYGGRPFMLDAHLKRMAHGCSVIMLPMPEPDEIKGWVSAALEANDLSDAYLRITVTRGPTGGVWYDFDQACPTVIILCKPYAQPDYGDGLRLRLSTFRSDEQSPLTRIKHTGLLWKIMARREARQSGVNDAMMLNTKGRVAEATSANAFWVRDGALYTPSLDSGILAGVTRGIVLEIAAEQGLKTVEGHFPFEKLLSAEEAFLTSSTWELAPIRSVEDMTFAEAPGKVTGRLAKLYRQRVMSDER